MQVNNIVIGQESGCPQDINSDPAWSENMYTPISNKPHTCKPVTICTTLLLQHLLFGDFANAFFLFSMSFFKFVGLHRSTSGKLVNTVLPNNARL
jgi:hypothetical protein